jgi:hypothetical protein
MKRTMVLLTTAALAGCSYLQGGPQAPAPVGKAAPAKASRGSIAPMSNGLAVVRAMHDKWENKFPKTISFLQNNTSYTTTGEERKTQWYEHLEVPGKLRIAFLPATQRSGLVQIGDRVATFENGIRVDFRPSINPLLLLTADVFAAPTATIMRGLDSLHVDTNVIRTDEWDDRPVYVVGAKAGDTTSNQMWVDAERLQLVRFIQSSTTPQRTLVSDTRIKNYKEIGGFEIPTEFLVLRNGRPVWREEYANVQVNQTFPAGTFDQARWNDIPIPK